MNKVQIHFEERLRARGLRVTPERRAVLEHAYRHFGHFDAAALLDSLRRHGCEVSRATVYRTLQQLVDNGLLRRHEIGDRQTFYEPEFGREHHEHMLCVECGSILEFVEQRIEQLQDEVCRRYRFHPVSHTLQIHGVCDTCRRRGGPRRGTRPRKPALRPGRRVRKGRR